MNLNHFPFSELIDTYLFVRDKTLSLCGPLEVEDYVVQPFPEVSPPKWHLGHTTWFFEEMILSKLSTDYKYFDETLKIVFNSYYKGAGQHWKQGERGQLSRPTLKRVLEYRKFVDDQLISFLNSKKVDEEALFLLELGIQHEQQHQELLLADIKSILFMNPDYPTYSSNDQTTADLVPESWKNFSEGVFEVGAQGRDFCFDNEKPCHKTYLQNFSMRETLVSNAEYLEFIEDKGYSQSRYWLSKGWDWVNEEKIDKPLYWLNKEGKWYEFTLYGLKPLDLNAPLTHISYFEANAFANWMGYRLPTEFELEHYLNTCSGINADQNDQLHPGSAKENHGQVWCWTSSHYSAYPKFQQFKGLASEYNGKFMCNQFVLRGGCVATPQNHYRHTYRNFYEPHQRWMFSGIRLTKDI